MKPQECKRTVSIYTGATWILHSHCLYFSLQEPYIFPQLPLDLQACKNQQGHLLQWHPLFLEVDQEQNSQELLEWTKFDDLCICTIHTQSQVSSHFHPTKILVDKFHYHEKTKNIGDQRAWHYPCRVNRSCGQTQIRGNITIFARSEVSRGGAEMNTFNNLRPYKRTYKLK